MSVFEAMNIPPRARVLSNLWILQDGGRNVFAVTVLSVFDSTTIDTSGSMQSDIVSMKAFLPLTLL